jgi:hypothetical protein
VRQPAEGEQLIDLAATTSLREIRLTSEQGYNLSALNGIHNLRRAVKLAERESRKTSERLRRKLVERARNGQGTVVVGALATSGAIWRSMRPRPLSFYPSRDGKQAVNAGALNWYIRESVFDHFEPEKVADRVSGRSRMPLRTACGQRIAAPGLGRPRQYRLAWCASRHGY